MALGLFKNLFSNNQSSAGVSQDPNASYFNNSFWDFGNTSPSYWTNIQNPQAGTWGNYSLMGSQQTHPGGYSLMGSQTPQSGGYSMGNGFFGQPSLLDILAQMYSPQQSGGW